MHILVIVVIIKNVKNKIVVCIKFIRKRPNLKHVVFIIIWIFFLFSYLTFI